MTPKHSMNTAICLAGTGTAIEHTFQNLKECLIDNIDNSDVIVYLAKNPHSDNAQNYFLQLSNSCVSVVEEETLSIKPYRFQEGFPPNPNSSREIFMQMLKSKSHLNTLIDQNEKRLNKKYDRVIFSRMDVKYEQPIKESVDRLDLSKLWLPNFHNWCEGYNDRFAVSSRENMRHYFSVYDYVDIYTKERHCFHAETTLKYHLDKKGVDIGIFELYFSRVRSGGLPHESYERIKTQAMRPCTT